MDTSMLVQNGLDLRAPTLGMAYTLLAVCSPHTIVPKLSERTYHSPCKPAAKLTLPSVRDSPSVDLLIVIPAYNASAALPDMFSRTDSHLESIHMAQGRLEEVLIVDDGSHDGTADLVLMLSMQYLPEQRRCCRC
ncbi:hypothetical protein C8T65DRAFT_747551 [Cerioporus squamosus]|nr:hypothetical protein C8T65DRAFT_747551 [Cerioporus squamosus]